MRKEFPMLLTVLAGLLVIVSQFFKPINDLKLLDTADKWILIMGAVSTGIAVVGLGQLHLTYIRRRREGWPLSVYLLVIMVAYGLLGLFGAKGLENPTFKWIFGDSDKGILVPLDSTVYGMIAFFITTAAYRAFKIKSLEGTVLYLTALIFILGTAPIGDALIPGWGTFKQWLLDNIGTAAMRSVVLGTFVGGFATALRVLLGLERAHLGGGGLQ